MGFTRTDIQITISNMHQQNIVIALISIVFLTHASEITTTTIKQTFTHFLRYQFTQIALHLRDLVFYFYFSTIWAPNICRAVYRHRKIFHKQLQFSPIRNCLLWQCSKLLAFYVFISCGIPSFSYVRRFLWACVCVCIYIKSYFCDMHFQWDVIRKCSHTHYWLQS